MVENRKNFKIKYYPSQSTNLAKRYVLEGIGHLIMSDLGQEWLEWDEIKFTFQNKCCYCGESERNDKKLTQEHLIMIKNNGLHHIGNVVPACGQCNSRRKSKPWEDFLRDNCNGDEDVFNERLGRIQKHINDHGYDKALEHKLVENLDGFMSVFPELLEQNIKGWLNAWTETMINKTQKGNLDLQIEVINNSFDRVGTVIGGYHQNQPIQTEFKEILQGSEEDEQVSNAKHFVEMVVESYDTCSKLK